MMRNRIWLFSVFIMMLIITGCEGGPVRGPGSKVLYEEVSLNTSDGIMLAADYYPSPSEKGLILLHMLARSKNTYRDITKELVPYYKILAVDFRGHGESEGDYTELVEDDFMLMINDIEAAAKALIEQGVDEKHISIVGASVGANLAVLYATKHPVEKLLLISPGMRYRGVDIERTMYRKPVFIQVGHYDAYSSISVDQLEGTLEKARVMVYESSAHGTDLLKYDVSAREDFLFYLT